MKITDKGNKFGFNVKKDFDTLLFKIPEEKEDTITFISLPSGSTVAITEEDGVTEAEIPPKLLTGAEGPKEGSGEGPGGGSGEDPGVGSGEGPGEGPGGGSGEDPGVGSGEGSGEGPGGGSGEDPGVGSGEGPSGDSGESPGEGSGEGPENPKRGPGKYELKYQYEEPLGAGYTKIRIEERKSPEHPWKVKEEYYLDPKGKKKRRLSKKDESIINPNNQSKKQFDSAPVIQSGSESI